MEVPEKVAQEAELELARSSGWTSALIYPIVLVAGAYAFDLYQSDKDLILASLPLLLLCCALRLFSAHRIVAEGVSRKYVRLLHGSILGIAVSWSAYHAGILLRHGAIWPGHLALLVLLVSAAVSCMSMMANLKLLRAYLVLIGLTATIGVMAIDPTRFFILSLLVLATMALMFQQSTFNHRRYLAALLARDEVLEARELARQRYEGEQQQRSQLEARQAELMESRRSAEQASRAKGEFLATMSHEIRTPMNAIFGMSEMLLESTLSEHQRDWAETIKTSCEALLTLINDILDFSKIESGKLEVSSKPVDVRRTVQEALSLMVKAAEKKQVKLSSNIGEEVPAFVISDGGRLRQILLNLLSNAVKFTREGNVSITVSFSSKLILFQLRDSGIGIPKDRMHRLFQSFSQVDSSTTRMYGGTGLGLVISQRLCEKLGGQIWVESGGALAGRPAEGYQTVNSNKGSIFCFTIAAEPTEGPAGLTSRTHNLASTEPDLDMSGLIGLPILVVEDNAVNQKVLLQMLKRFDVSATPVSSGQEALDVVKTQRFPLILMDIQMPGMDGYATTVAIRKKYSPNETWITAITANAFQEDREACLKLGMNDYLSKPVRQTELAAALQRFLKKETAS